jgi:hypothetical protein
VIKAPANPSVTGIIVLFACVGMLAYLMQLSDLVTALRDGDLAVLADTDFVNYWMAGKLALNGQHLDLFTQSIYSQHLQQNFGPASQFRNWSYPPHALFFCPPLALMPFDVALVVFLSAGLLFFVWSAYKFHGTYYPDGSGRKTLAWVILGFAAAMCAAVQNGFITGGLTLLGLAWMRRRPALAGLAFGILTIKPQLGLLLPLLLILDRNWSAFMWAAISATALMFASLVIFGVESWRLYLTDSLAFQTLVMTSGFGVFLRMMPTVFGSARTFGLDYPAAMAVQWSVTLVAGMLLVRALWRDNNPLRRSFLVVVGPFLLSPYAFNYDMGALAVVAGTLVISDVHLMSRNARLLVAFTAVLPALVIWLGRAGIPIAPLFLLGSLITVVYASETRRRCAREPLVP